MLIAKPVGRLAMCSLLVTACSEGVASTSRTVVRQTDSYLRIELSESPTSMAHSQNELQIPTADLLIGGVEAGFEEIADVKASADGFAVLDRRAANLIGYDFSGIERWRVGREGEGPGEYKAAAAFTLFGDSYVIWDIRSNTAFTIMGSTRAVLATAVPQIDGDWTRIAFRNPKVFADGYQMGPSDITRRLQPFTDSLFIHENRAREQQGSDGEAALSTHLVVYSSRGVPVDTLITLTGPRTSRDLSKPGFVNYEYIEAFYSARPLWDSFMDGYLAIAHGDSSSAVVLRGGDTLAVVDWPRSRVEITEADRLANANWEADVQLWSSSDFGDSWLRLPKFARNRILNRYVESHPEWFAHEHPQVAALYAAGRCIFLAGSNARDAYDGTSLTWWVIDVFSGEDVVLRLPRRGTRVRDVSATHIYTTFRDSDGVWYVERYPIEGISCTQRNTE